ncbi:septal ring lytic transglycosylase RlpA family protein [Paraburkholderia phytofirmans]|uniref:Endolytic peptidoglycan transglycosylase RlpA n=1 Tax=Paraburkholderia phytofirmans TaxID=261302 RepID=A0ABW9BFF8_9BURK
MKDNLHTTHNRLPGDAHHVRLRRARRSSFHALLFVVSSCFLSTALAAQPSAPADTGPASATPAPRHLDRSGKSRKGKASYYGPEFYKKEMADGTPMNPQSNAAASKTLPLGTKARVTNLKNGNSEVVEIRDRGPYVKDRIVDLSPKTADKLGLKKDGVVPVEVKPVEVPQADGTVKPGAAVQESERGKSPVDVQHSLH